MLRSLNSLFAYTLKGQDGSLGVLKDVLFDDLTWVCRYLVVDAEDWLAGREVLIVPAVCEAPQPEQNDLTVALTRDQVARSPDIDARQPVSRRQEIALHTYYNWPAYWVPQQGMLTPVGPAITDPAQEQEDEPSADPHLRSFKEVNGYRIVGADGEAGHIEDFIIEDETWDINYLVVKVGSWLIDRTVLVPPTWIKTIDWAEASFQAEISRESIKNSPEFDPSTPIVEA